jgi:hypothetical protein
VAAQRVVDVWMAESAHSLTTWLLRPPKPHTVIISTSPPRRAGDRGQPERAVGGGEPSPAPDRRRGDGHGDERPRDVAAMNSTTVPA